MSALTRRQKDVLVRIAQGKTYEVIARELSISRRTVAVLANEAFSRLEAQGAANAVAIAIVREIFSVKELNEILDMRSLHPTQLKVVLLLAAGISVSNVARKLGYSIDTVIQYRNRGIKALGANSVEEAAEIARQRGYDAA